MASARPFLRLLKEQRRRLATLFLLIGLAVMAHLLGDSWPREHEVHFLLGPEAGAVVRADIAYQEEGEGIVGVQLNYPNDPPKRLVHRPSLRAGRYDVIIDLTANDGRSNRYMRVLDIPSEGTVRFRLAAPEEP